MKLKKSDYMCSLDSCSREPNEDGVSEYHIRLAISRLPDEFTHEELSDEVAEVISNEVLSSLVDKGVAETFWDPDTNDFGVRVKQ